MYLQFLEHTILLYHNLEIFQNNLGLLLVFGAFESLSAWTEQSSQSGPLIASIEVQNSPLKRTLSAPLAACNWNKVLDGVVSGVFGMSFLNNATDESFLLTFL